MNLQRFFAHLTAGVLLVTLGACSGVGSGSIGSGSIGSGGGGSANIFRGDSERARQARVRAGIEEENRTTIFDLFSNNDDPNVTLNVNKYIWNAALDVLNFLPIEAADPFSGVIVTGYGTPPGGSRSYRATIYVTDPALDARSLNVAMQRRGGGTVDPDTARAIEDAILTRARQLRISDGNL
ncbi:MAG: DUF3576 domain-containing protein [Halocynthiibacter sp.]